MGFDLSLHSHDSDNEGMAYIYILKLETAAHFCNIWLQFPLFYCLLSAHVFPTFRVRYLPSCYTDLDIFFQSMPIKIKWQQTKTRRRKRNRWRPRERGGRKTFRNASLSEISCLHNFSHCKALI